MATEKPLPQDAKAEYNLLAMAASGGEFGDVAQECAFLQPDDFYINKNGQEWKAVLRLKARGEPIEPGSIWNELETMGEVGPGLSFEAIDELTEHMQHLSVVADAKAYARRIRRCKLLRRIIEVNAYVAGDAYNKRDPEEIIAALRRELDLLDSGDPQPPEETVTDGSVQAFPIDVYPAVLRNFIEEAARAINCPPDFIGAPLLAYLGAALGNSVCVEIKPGWKESTRIWLALVAQPGDKKSPAVRVIDDLFHEHQRGLHADFKAKHDEWKQTDDGSPEPVFKQIITTDATLEALSDLLQNNPRGMLFARDELTGWALSMNQYKNGKGADRQNWLSLWNGASLTINRRNRKNAIVLDRPFVGVVGTLQPDVLGDLSDERGRQDGFIHRILFAYPDRVLRKWTDDELSPGTIEDMRIHFDGLWRVQPAKEESGRIEPHVYRFTKTGKEAWVKWIEEHYAEQEAQDFPDNLGGPWAKMEGYAARIALILHQSRSLCKETQHMDIDEVSMAGAVKLINYFKSHVRRVYAQLYTPPEERIITTLLEWIRRQKSGIVTVREVMRAGVAGIKKSDDAKYLLEQIAERGYGMVEEISPKRGRKVFRFTLNKDAQRSTFDIKASAQAGSAA